MYRPGFFYQYTDWVAQVFQKAGNIVSELGKKEVAATEVTYNVARENDLAVTHPHAAEKDVEPQKRNDVKFQQGLHSQNGSVTAAARDQQSHNQGREAKVVKLRNRGTAALAFETRHQRRMTRGQAVEGADMGHRTEVNVEGSELIGAGIVIGIPLEDEAAYPSEGPGGDYGGIGREQHTMAGESEHIDESDILGGQEGTCRIAGASERNKKQSVFHDHMWWRSQRQRL